MSGVDKDFNSANMLLITELKALTVGLSPTIARLQLSLAGDALFVPLLLLGLIRKITHTVVTLVPSRQFKELLLSRFTRRFFFEQLNLDSEFLGNNTHDRTGKFDFFSNVYVMSAWALSPLANFQEIVDMELVTEGKRSLLEALARDSLLQVHKFLRPGDFDATPEDYMPLGNPKTPKEKHDADIVRFRKKTDVLWDDLQSGHENRPRSYAELRTKYCEKMVVAAAPIPWIHDVLRAAYGWRSTSVQDERHFSVLQSTLEPHLVFFHHRQALRKLWTEAESARTDDNVDAMVDEYDAVASQIEEEEAASAAAPHVEGIL